MGLTKTELYDDTTNYLGLLFACIGHPARLSILFLLRDHDAMTVGEITNALMLSQSTVSEHLSILKQRALIKSVRIGTSMSYHLNQQVYPAFKDVLRNCSEEF
jgi:ArsR family transcriptional regulator, arsenate/arsenite/antimonite-responsive transcriptional repressor